MSRPVVVAMLLAAALAGCSDVPQAAVTNTPLPAGCLSDGTGSLQAALRGALDADVAWDNDRMECDGDLRPDGSGLRITIAGPLPAALQAAAAGDATRRLRFIFGIDLNDNAEGPAEVRPTNLTVIIEGGEQLYATRGSELCAVEGLERVASAEEIERVSVRGYCLGPASDLTGEHRLLVPTFSFTALVRTGEEGDQVLQLQ